MRNGDNDSTDVRRYFPWLPGWLDVNVVVPVGATIVVIIVGIVVICVALSRRTRGPEQTRLRGISSADEKYYEGQCISIFFYYFTQSLITKQRWKSAGWDDRYYVVIDPRPLRSVSSARSSSCSELTGTLLRVRSIF